jgi:ferredoxin
MIRIHADFDKCEAYANCIVAAPDLFAINDENFVEILDERPGPEQVEAAKEAVRTCPTRALSLVSE